MNTPEPWMVVTAILVIGAFPEVFRVAVVVLLLLIIKEMQI